MKTLDAKRVLEAALICSSQPMALREMQALFAGEIGNDTLRTLLDELAAECGERAIELVAVASGWRYQTRPEMADYLARLDPERAPRYSRAVLETLAIIAYRQPVTRGDMEDIRGVTINALIIKQLEDRGWVEVIGHRETAGRPALFATTRQFLDDLGLQSLDQLPVLDSPGQQAHLLSALGPAIEGDLPGLAMDVEPANESHANGGESAAATADAAQPAPEGAADNAAQVVES